MPVTTVGDVMRRVKFTLQEAGTGVRWSDAELLDWLNESYMAIVVVRDDANSVASMQSLEAGARQTLPSDGLKMLRVNRNGKGRAMMRTTLGTLNASRRNWYGEAETDDPEQYALDDTEPTAFYIYPPASSQAQAEIVYSKVPARHTTDSLDAVESDSISVRDEYSQALVDYVLYRAFGKDAEGQQNMARANMHYKSFAGAMGLVGGGNGG